MDEPPAPAADGLAAGASARDATVERELAECRLLHACVEQLDDVVLITDADLDPPGPRIVYANAAVERVCGYTPAQMIGRTPRMLQGPHTDPAERARIRRALAAGEAVRAELLNYAKDGRPYWIELSVTPVRDRTGRITHFVAVEHDITARREAQAQRAELEAQLRQAQKMDALGTLAGGIAHDFNNLLGAILGHLELAHEDLPAASPVHENLGHIRHASLRARGLVQRILAFSRSQAQPMHDVALAPLVEGTVAMLRAILPAGVRLALATPLANRLVRGDANQLEQVLVNLCTNAWQALQGQPGTIGVGLDEAAPAGRSGDWAHLWVSDTGIGMDEDTARRVFEPFFTTKPAGQGTGLGLSVVHGIIGRHGGSVTADSRPGAGATFHVHLPALPAGAAAARPPSADALPRSQGQGERVLYVDDDPVMLVMAERLLARRGFAPTCTADPHQALRWIAEDPRRFDVVVTDYNMPAMTGAQLAEAMRSLRVDLPVVLISGYVTEEQHAQAQRIGAWGPVDKQNCLEELSTWILRAARQAGGAG